MATRKTTAKKRSKPPLVIRTFSLTADHDAVLGEIAATASDHLGWTVSSSAIVRALIGFMGEQGLSWTSREILPRIDQEISAGRVWGTKAKSVII